MREAFHMHLKLSSMACTIIEHWEFIQRTFINHMSRYVSCNLVSFNLETIILPYHAIATKNNISLLTYLNEKYEKARDTTPIP